MHFHIETAELQAQFEAASYKLVSLKICLFCSLSETKYIRVTTFLTGLQIPGPLTVVNQVIKHKQYVFISYQCHKYNSTVKNSYLLFTNEFWNPTHVRLLSTNFVRTQNRHWLSSPGVAPKPTRASTD